MSSSRVRFSLHISAHRGEERRAEKEAEGETKEKYEGDEEGWNRGGRRVGWTNVERKIHLPFMVLIYGLKYTKIAYCRCKSFSIYFGKPFKLHWLNASSVISVGLYYCLYYKYMYFAVCEGETKAGILGDKMFSGPCCLFLEQAAALKATAAPCHCYEHIAGLRIGQLIWSQFHTHSYSGMFMPNNHTVLNLRPIPEFDLYAQIQGATSKSN